VTNACGAGCSFILDGPAACALVSYQQNLLPMTRHLLNIAVLLLLTAPTFADEVWPGVKFSEVRAYAWPYDKETEAVILKDFKLEPGAINPGGSLLSPEQIRALVRAVTGKHAKYPVAACHIPHNAFVFFDAVGKPVAFMEI
jgi:hypothetical protein